MTYLLSTFPSPEELKGTVQGTMLYLALYFGIIIPFQAFSKFYLMKQKVQESRASGMSIDFRAVKYYNRSDHIALVSDRSVGQFVEFSILFLPLLWMHALFLSDGAAKSWTICIVYTISRAFYPIVFGKQVYPGVLWSAVPNYVVLIYMLGRLGFACMFD